MNTETYLGQIVLVDTYDKFEKAIRFLNTLDEVGIDTESRPVFKKGRKSDVALVQISSHDKCFLIRVKCIGGVPHDLIRFFENDKIKKIGLSLIDDIRRLHDMVNFTPAGFIDLQQYVKGYCIRDNALERIYGILFGKRISKCQRLSNWENNVLTESQQKYAALDAWACLKIYDYLEQGNFNPEKSPYVVKDEE